MAIRGLNKKTAEREGIEPTPARITRRQRF
jgi:hypothetical protein